MKSEAGFDGRAAPQVVPLPRLRPAGKTGGVFLWSSAAVLRDRQTWADHFAMIFRAHYPKPGNNKSRPSAK
jgi:hypothetical protein